MMNIILNDDALLWLERNNISFHNRFGIRMRVGYRLSFYSDLEVEPYIGIHEGNVIPDIGYMSYSNSALPEDIKIGRYCSLARDIRFSRYRHPIEHVSTSIFTHDPETDLVVRAIRDSGKSYTSFFPNRQKGPIKIGHDVWIGENTMIMPGVVIGTGSIVAAGSVVTKSIPPFSVVGGNPACLIKPRFPSSLSNQLLQSEWWNYNFTEFCNLPLDDPEEFVLQFERTKKTLKTYFPDRVKLKELGGIAESA